MRRPSPALVIASLALLVALTGTSYATVLNVPKNSVGTSELRRNAVKPAKLAPNAVRTAHVLNGSLLAADFRAGQIPQGPKGDKGDAGAIGPSGLSGWQRIEVESASNSDIAKTVIADCPAGKRVVGGGTEVVPAIAAGPALMGDGPNGDTGWRGQGREIVATNSNWQVRVEVICATVGS